MINDAPAPTRKLMAKQGNISNSCPKHTNIHLPCCSNPCSRRLKYDNPKSIVRSCKSSSKALRSQMLLPNKRL